MTWVGSERVRREKTEEWARAGMNEGAAEKPGWGKMVFSSLFPYLHLSLLFCLTGSKVSSVGNGIRGKVGMKTAG